MAQRSRGTSGFVETHRARHKEDIMARALLLAATFLVVLGIALPAGVAAQTKEDTIIYALQSDVDNWDPPNSVLREAITGTARLSP
jgi:hypothetical protein